MSRFARVKGSPRHPCEVRVNRSVYDLLHCQIFQVNKQSDRIDLKMIRFTEGERTRDVFASACCCFVFCLAILLLFFFSNPLHFDFISVNLNKLVNLWLVSQSRTSGRDRGLSVCSLILKCRVVIQVVLTPDCSLRCCLTCRVRIFPQVLLVLKRAA